jgi:hypothetical protein
LPAEVIKTAVELVTGSQDQREYDLYYHLTATATAAMGVVQAEQQQEVAALRQRTAALEAAQAEQQQQTGALQQQVLEMQAAMQHLLQGPRQ